MNISIFEVAGPVMIGPSSSHTAGAARLARVAAHIAVGPFRRVSFGLFGSFAKTYKGHGTDRALVAGALGLREDDERLADAFSIAAGQGLAYDFYEVELDSAHQNTVQMDFTRADGSGCRVVGSSLGGGEIVISRVGDFAVEFSARMPTLLVRQQDARGVISEVSRALADAGINIGVMRVSRTAKGDTAFCVIETDDALSDAVVGDIRNLPHVLEALAIDIGREG